MGTYVDIYLCIYTYVHARIQNMYNISMKGERKRVKKSKREKVHARIIAFVKIYYRNISFVLSIVVTYHLFEKKSVEETC